MDGLKEAGSNSNSMQYVHMHKESKQDASWDGPSGITTTNIYNDNNYNEDLNLNLKCMILGGGGGGGSKLEEEESRRRSATSAAADEESSSSSSGTANWLQLGLPNNNNNNSSSDLMLDLNLHAIPSLLPPPPPHHPSIWFSLLPSLPQSVPPYLPRLSKTFLRIKDARMTVGLVMKYLANKLGLHSELQVEIRCRGQVLGPFLTLQHVRDYIWSPSHALTLLPNSSTTPHLMLLHYSSSTYLPSIQPIY